MNRIDIRTLHQDVAGKIREMIRKGTLTRGQRIIEAELCEQIGVSRTPLREALRVLESEGLVELFPHRGVHIRQPSMREIEEMFEVMSVLEGTCARLAVKNMTPAAWRRIERLHQKLEAHYAEGDREKYVAVNNVLHALIQEQAGNRVLDDILRRLRGLAVTVTNETASGEDVTDQYVDLQSQLTNLQATQARIASRLTPNSAAASCSRSRSVRACASCSRASRLARFGTSCITPRRCIVPGSRLNE